LTDPDSVTVWLSGATADPRGQAGALVLAAAAATLGLPVARLRLGYTGAGRPQVEVAAPVGKGPTGTPGRADGVHVAVSHTDGTVAVAATTRGPVGVDAERVRVLPALALARRWFTADEAYWLSTLPESLRSTGFLLLWTQKEAVGKALGTGLRGSGTRRAMPRPYRVDARASEPRPVPESASIVVSGWLERSDLVLAVACVAPVGLGVRVIDQR